jgi:hypothetical protein
MTTIEITSDVVRSPDEDVLAEAHLAAAAFMARYQGRTLDAYRHDLRVFFQWALEVDLDAGCDSPVTPRRAAPGQGNRASLGPIDRQESRARAGASSLL